MSEITLKGIEDKLDDFLSKTIFTNTYGDKLEELSEDSKNKIKQLVSDKIKEVLFSLEDFDMRALGVKEREGYKIRNKELKNKIKEILEG